MRASDAADEQHLREFATTRRGVEGFVEPRTAVSDVTMMLVAHDGEWTRRRVPSVEWAHRFANQHGVPSYDAAVVGYPSRMREYNRRKKDSLGRGLVARLAGREPASSVASSTSVATAKPVPPLVTWP